MKPLRSTGGPLVLILIQDAPTRATVTELLAPLACTIFAENTAEAEALLRQETYGVLIIEDELSVETGLMFLARIQPQHPWLRSILICGELDSALLMFLINEANVFRCATKPVNSEVLGPLVQAALAEHTRLRRLAADAGEVERLRAEMAAPSRRARNFAATLRQWRASLPRFFLFSFLGAAWVLGLGTATLVALYLLKVLLGIDLVEGMHLRDLFR